jgi:hypothetical protein
MRDGYLPHNQRRQRPVGSELVILFAELEIDLSANGIVQVDLAIDHILPCGRARVCNHVSYKFTEPLNKKKLQLQTFEIRHVGPNIRVQGVDNHLPVGGTGDLYPSVHQPGRRVGSSPCGVVPDVLGLR